MTFESDTAEEEHSEEEVGEESSEVDNLGFVFEERKNNLGFDFEVFWKTWV